MKFVIEDDNKVDLVNVSDDLNGVALSSSDRYVPLNQQQTYDLIASLIATFERVYGESFNTYYTRRAWAK